MPRFVRRQSCSSLQHDPADEPGSKPGAIYFDALLGCGEPLLPLLEQVRPQAATAPPTSNAPPAHHNGPPRKAAPQAPGEFEVEDASAVGDNHQFSVRPSVGIWLLAAPGCNPPPLTAVL
jgi:hypothetical protein